MMNRLLMLLALSAGHVAAQDRNPTVWPAGVQPPPAAASTASDGTAEPPTARHVVFQNGRAYLVQRGRRYQAGDMLDGARIQRIDETAVWWNENGQVRREPLYGGVEKRLPKTSKEKP